MWIRKYRFYAVIVIFLALVLLSGLLPWTSYALNRQGVRTDVALAIDEAFPDAKFPHLASVQLARAFQRAIDKPEDAAKIEEDWFKAKCCLEAVTRDRGPQEAGRISSLIESLVVNSWSRSRSYLKYNAALSGGVYPVSYPNLKSCAFKVR